MALSKPSALLLILFFNLLLANDEYDSYAEFASSEGERGLFPNIFNLATNAIIKANATCGLRQRETYCKLVEHVFNRKPQCDECDMNDPRKRHAIEYAIDGSRRWWQSPSLANGLKYERVTITIDLRQEYQVAYIIVKSAIAPRPGTWVLEKSSDGINYQPWQFYATSDAECMRHFGVPAAVGVPRFSRDDEVICTSYYSKLDPLENGEIHTSLVNGRPSAEAASELLQEFTRARYVQLRFMSLRTLNADLMVINHRDHRLDLSVTRRYFYAIRDISIGGQCICHGHAESCPPDPVTGQFRCDCRHNTCGETCDICCPLFNQLPWKQGTQSHPNICQACQCFNHAERCEYDAEVERLGLSVTPEGIFEGGGKCIDCQHNTDGINCERCKWTYYRPARITHYREDACRPCDCDPIGSEHENCVRDETSAVDGQQPGDCICKPGFGGRRCDVCAPGYRNHPKCEPCPCNQAGSLNFDTCEEDKCACKSNVEGLYCDRCKPGTIHLNLKNPLGCQSCFCFGLGSECHEKEWDKGKIRNNFGWSLADYSLTKLEDPKTENGELLMYNVDDHKEDKYYYWKAPSDFLGNKLRSYGGYLHYYVYFVPVRDGEMVSIADIILEGNGLKMEYHSRQDLFPKENISVLVPLKEDAGWYNSERRVPIEKTDMMRVLASVKNLYIRAMYHQRQIQSSIYGLALDHAIEPNRIENNEIDEDVLKPKAPVDTLMRGVEVCNCPPNFDGLSCESCIKGYRRVNDQLYGGHCEKCVCEGHSDECDPHTGHCVNCKHNTTGFRCHQCLPGHYGNPSLGDELGQCRPCACPTIENNRSPDCVLTQLIVDGAAASTEDVYVCTACETGYDGNKCEICADGYFGDPLAVNGSCEPCICNGNIDPMAIGNCDRETGKCLKCIYNTDGDECERCKENHWGSIGEKACKACNCHPVGSKTPNCDVTTGLCECYENYEGAQCDKCMEGHGDVENMCPPCKCDSVGSFGTECDQFSGQCACKTGVFGKHCDKCRASYFNFTESGCQFCYCNTYGAVDDGKCDTITGKCDCRANVDGIMCEKCKNGYFNITSGQGCQECDCDKQGSEGIQCDIHTGQCVCKKGVSGLKCDECAPNHFGMSEEGCQECKECPAPGQVCHPVTGVCVCPPNTVGEICENCTDNAYNHDPLKGCTLCDCSNVGADGPNCNPINGQCNCRPGYIGIKCDRCTHGYYDFPNCEPCNCNFSGTDPKTCGDEGLCLCDDHGQCSCKKNVEGLKCDKCKANSFSLSKSNLHGCTECFCFNRTMSCKQADLKWQQIYADDRMILFDEPWEIYNRRHNLNILKMQPRRYNSYLTDSTPLYWPMPNSFLGDKIASYNGYIRFKIQNADNQRGIDDRIPDAQYFKFFPQVVIVGNHRIILEHIPQDIDENGRYKIRLHESQWRSRLSPEVPVTRKQMMVVLQNVQAIYIRATYNYPYKGDTSAIKEASLDVGVREVASDSTDLQAIGVEMCDCPRGYAGYSCQDAAEGYCRKRVPDFLNSEDDLALIGWPEPCSCNGHSVTCFPESCRCTNCQHNTFGDYCQYCKPGYHGDAFLANENACTKCACPLANNSFSETCVPVSHGRGYICDACKRGYTGKYCESCVSGYYGNPNLLGGNCSRCDCHPHGSKSGICDPITGQCECNDGVTGRDCSECQERHAFIGGICSSCDQGCTKEFMIMVDKLEQTLGTQNFSNLRPIPWKRVARIENTTKDIYAEVNSFEIDRKVAKELVDTIGSESKHIAEAHSILDQAKFLQERFDKSKERVDDLLADTIQIDDESRKQFGDIRNIVQQLQHYVTPGGERPASAVTDALLKEAMRHLNATRERDQYIEKRYNRAVIELDKAEELLKQITSKKLNNTVFLSLKNRLDRFYQWVDEYRTIIWDIARQNTTSAKRVADIVTKRTTRFNNVVSNITDILAKGTDEISKAERLVHSETKGKILDLFDFRGLNKTLVPEVRQLINRCREEADKYGQILGEYRHLYVNPGERYSKRLEEEAGRLHGSFADTKAAAENPIRASNAYKEIVEALKNATKAADKAKKAAEEAFLEADHESQTSMVNLAAQARNASLELKEQVANMHLDTLEEEKDSYQRSLDKVNRTILDGQKKKLSISEQYQSFDDQHDRMTGLVNVAANAAERASKAQKEADELVKKLNETSSAVANLKDNAGESVRDTTDKVRKATEEAKDAMNHVVEARKQIEEDAKRIADLGTRISLLKEKIKEAREKASKIKLSMKSDESGACRRSYISPTRPAPTNKISIRYRPYTDVPNSLIFLTKTVLKRTQPSEYIAAELHNMRIIVHWNIGSGRKKVTNTHTINNIAQGDRATWYHIDIERVGNSMTVTVAQKQTIRGEGIKLVGEPTTARVGTPSDGNDVIFNTIPGETKIQFGTDRETAEDLGFSTNSFFGTIGEFVIDGQSVPLWSFSQTNEVCEGDFDAPTMPSVGHMFRDGFAQIHLSVVDKPSDSRVTIIFAAYSPDGLLYFRGDANSGQFISVHLSEGRIVFKVNLGGDSIATVMSKRFSYSDSRLHTIQAIRNNDELHLQVDNQNDRSTIKIPGNKKDLSLNDDNHYIGGVPPDFNQAAFEKYGIIWTGFFGCIQSIKPSDIELDLEHAKRSQRKSQGCSFKENDHLESSDRIVGFEQPGFVLTQGVQLSDNSTFSFAFRTRVPNATLLFQSSKLATHRRWDREIGSEGGQGYIAFYLFRGVLVVHLGIDASQRSKVLTLRSENTYNDGQLHSVHLTRLEKMIYLRVDDREAASGTLTDRSKIGSPSSQMFIGGFPEKVKPSSNELPATEPLIGCVSEIFTDFKLLPIVPEAHQAIIGSCPMGQTLPPSDITTDEPPQADQQAFDRKSSKLTFEIKKATVSTSDDHGDDENDLNETVHALPTVIPDFEPFEPILDLTTPLPEPEKEIDYPQIQCGPTMLADTDGDGAARFGITESSHSRLNFHKEYPNIASFKISFTFRTTNPTGILWVWANYKTFARYFKLNLIQGLLRMEVKGHKNPKISNYRSPKLNDGEWHYVQITKEDKQMTIKVDTYKEHIINDLPNPKVMRKRMYVGGVISRYKKDFHLDIPNFVGCLRNFAVDGVERDIFASSRDIIPCYVHSKSFYVHEGGYAIYDPVKAIGSGNDILISAQFRPGVNSGLIFGFMTSKDLENNRIVLYLKNGLLVFELILSELRRDLKHVYSQSLCDGNWHNLQLYITSGDIRIQVDNEIERPPTETSQSSIEMFRSFPIYIGGLPSTLSEKIGISSTNGCFRDLRILRKEAPLSKAKKTSKVVPNSCPFLH